MPAPAPAAGASDRCGEGRGDAAAGEAQVPEGRAGGGERPAGRRPCPSCAIGNSPRYPPCSRCPPPAELGPLAGGRRGHGGESGRGARTGRGGGASRNTRRGERPERAYSGRAGGNFPPLSGPGGPAAGRGQLGGARAALTGGGRGAGGSGTALCPAPGPGCRAECGLCRLPEALPLPRRVLPERPLGCLRASPFFPAYRSGLTQTETFRGLQAAGK